MSELLREFVEAAERQVTPPRLAELESRGRDLRRARRLAVVAAAFLVLAGTGLVVRAVGGDRADLGPVDEPVARAERLDNIVPDGFEETLDPGAQHVVTLRPPSGGEASLQARFTVPGSSWQWWGSGATKNLVEAEDVNNWEPSAVVTVTRSDRVATTQCRIEIPIWEDLADEPLVAARQITEVPQVDVLRGPREVAKFGHVAAHVRLSVPRVCKEWNDILLWGLTPDDYGGSPGVGTVRRAGNRLDVWVINVDGALVVVRAEHTPGLPSSFVDEMRSLVDSIRIEPAEE